MLKQALVLAGGLGTRLGHRTRDVPKPMLPVGDRPFLDYVVRHLGSYGVEHVLLSVGHLAGVVIDYFDRNPVHGVRIGYVWEEEPAGTAGPLRLAAPELEPEFFMLNGDTLFDVDLVGLGRHHRRSGAEASMALREVEDVSRYGAIELGIGDRVRSVAEKSAADRGLINGGVYALSRAMVDRVKRLPCSFENEVLPELVLDGALSGFLSGGFFIDIGVPDSLEAAQEEVPEWWSRPAVFLDRDGVLNVDHGHVGEIERFEWIPGARWAVRLLNEAGYRVVVVTNQSGIGRGYYDESQFLRLMRWMNERLADEGAHFDAVYYCPHHPEHGRGELRVECDCRKPGSALLERAIRDLDLVRDASWLVGDKESDLEAARAAGIAAYRYDAKQPLDRFLEDVLIEWTARGSGLQYDDRF